MPDDEFTLDPKPRAKKPRAKKPPAEADSVVTRLEAAFLAAHEARWGCAPFVASVPRARKHLQDLAAQLGEDEVRRLIAVYFTTADYKVASRDYTIATFYTLVAHLRLLDQRAPHDLRTRDNVDAARRATQPKREGR